MKLDIRTKRQDLTISDYVKDKPFRSTFVLSTGFGKSRVAIEILKRLDPPKILILVNSEKLRDFTWKQEFKDFDAMYLYERSEIVTYQLAAKWTQKTKNLDNHFVVADEVDFAADTLKYSKFFSEYPDLPVLGMTGFITEAKRPWFDQNLPVYTKYTTWQAQSDGILNKIKVHLVKFMLSTVQTNEVEYIDEYGKKKSFYQSDNDSYDYHQKAIERIAGKKAEAKAEYLVGNLTSIQLDKKLKSLDYLYNKAATKRRDVILNSEANIQIAKALIEYKCKEEGSKIITFSKRVANAQKIGGETQSFHGANRKAVNNTAFNAFLNGDINYLSVCGKIDRGVTIPGLNVGIFESYFGDDTKAAQRFGRLLRLKPDEVAEVFILVPYYNRKLQDGTFKVSPTVQLGWAKDMLRSTVISDYSVWDYR